MKASETRFSDARIKTSTDICRDVSFKDTPQSFLKNMELGCKVLDMRKRSFIFFKRKLRPAEKAEALLMLWAKEVTKTNVI